MIVAVLAGLLGLLLFLASIPVDLKFEFDSLRSPRFRCRVGLLFSLVELDLPAGKRRPGPRKKRAKKKGGRFGTGFFPELLSRPLGLRFLDLARKILRAVHLRRLRADIVAGLGEPADTGMLFGYFSAALPLLHFSDETGVRWEPDFGDEPVLEGTSEGLVRLRPIAVILAALAFIFSEPVLRFMGRRLRRWRVER